jgi:RNA recognition motif-containing protein
MTSKNVWVGNLPAGFTTARLAELFSSAGVVTSSKVMTNPKGVCGLVEFADTYAAQSAIAQMNGHVVDGGTLICMPAKHQMGDKSTISQAVRTPQQRPTTPSSYPRAAQPFNSSSYSTSLPYQAKAVYSSATANGKSSSTEVNTNVWVGNVPDNFTEMQLHTLFGAYGAVRSARILRDKVTRTPKGAALVNFSTAHEAAVAIAGLNGCIVVGNDKPLILKLAMSDPTKREFSAANPTTSPHSGAAAMVTASHTPLIHLTNIWVGNLPLTFTESDLAALFGSCGTVASVKILKDKSSSVVSSSGAGLVNFSTPAEADYAVQAMNGCMFAGCEKPMVVKHAASAHGHPTPQLNFPTYVQPLPVAEIPAIQAPVGAAPHSDSVWIGNLPMTFTESDLYTTFSSYGNIVQATVIKNKETKESTGAGLVRFSTIAQAVSALNAMQGARLEVNGKPLEVKFSTSGRKSMVIGGAIRRPPGGSLAGANNFHPYR